MGTDYAGEAGMPGQEETGGTGGANGSGGRATTGGMPSTGGAGGKAARCDGFENTDFRDEVTVRYVNDGTEPLYIGRTRVDVCGGEFRFELRDDAGNPLATAGANCTSCKALQSGPPMCTTDCPQGQLVRIDPGGSHEFSWDGVYWAAGNMPKACFAAPGFDTCSKLVQAEPAQYHFVGTAWSGVICDPTLGCQQCVAGDTGSCVVPYPSATTGSARVVERVLDYPAQKLVELHFD
jgi:hypothetical protein